MPSLVSRRSGTRWRFPVLTLLVSLAAPTLVFGATAPVDGRVRLNSIGFTPGATKRATIADATATTFRVVRTADNAIVLEGALGATIQTAAGDTNETVRFADFTAVRGAGDYQLEIPGVGSSAPFRIAADVWNEPFDLITRGLYLWRCGTEVSGTWNGVHYHHAACHLGDGRLNFVDGGSATGDGTGGWHDAGDYNKYVVNAGVSVGLLFKAWEHFRERFSQHELDLPETRNGLPDLLNEIRWEIDWLRKMQAPDGSVYHKLSATNFNYWGVPENDTGPRYFVPGGTTAAADFVAMLALAARHFGEFDSAYAATCLDAARLTWTWLQANPNYIQANQTGFSTGGYEANDAVHRLWAAAEMWVTTDEAEFLADFETRAASRNFSTNGPTWGDVGDLGLGTYLQHDSAARNPALVQRLTNNLVARADAIVQTVNTHGYGRGLGGGNWYWGANGSVAAQTYLLHVADRLAPDPAYRDAAEGTLGFLFGRNFHNRSYVTGLGHLPPLHPHDRRGEPAWPGYLVGGGWPTGRDWVDEQSDYEQNEIALNWNASLIYALAAFTQPEHPVPPFEWAVFAAGQAGSHAPLFDGITPTSFAATGLPHWATLDPATGEINGTPANDPGTPEDDTRTNHAVMLQAFDGDELVATRGVSVMVARAGVGARVVNLSARAQVGAGENILIAGFATSGPGARELLLRGVGPSLLDHGVPDALSDSRIAVYAGSTQVHASDDWFNEPLADPIRARSVELGAFALGETSPDAVVLTDLDPGVYTVHVAGADDATGVALAEIYDGADAASPGQLENISARAWVSEGDAVLISGIVVSGGGSARVLVRAVGPSLLDHGVAAPLTDPVLTVFSGSEIIAINDDWEADAPDEIIATAEAVSAFPLRPGSRDAVLIATLVDGGFTIKVEGKYGESGVALAELYFVP